MAIEFACQQCGGQFAAPEELAGKKAKCKRCGAIVTVPIDLPAEPALATPRAVSARPVRQPQTAVVHRPPPATMQLPADLSPRMSGYTLPPAAAPRRGVPWLLVLVAGSAVVMLSVVVGLGVAAFYAWPHIARATPEASQPRPAHTGAANLKTAPKLAPPPVPVNAAAKGATAASSVSPALSNLPEPAPEQKENPDSEPEPVLKAHWSARPDPPPAPVKYKEGKIAISLPRNVELLLPSGPSHFILGMASDFQREAFQVFDLRTGKEIGKSIMQKRDHSRRLEAFSPDGRYFAGQVHEPDKFGKEVALGIWSFATGEMSQVLRLPGHSVSGPLCFAAAHQLVTLHEPDFKSSVLTLWNLQTGEKIREIPLPRGDHENRLRAESLAVSPGGRYATIVLGKQLGVIDLTTGEPAGSALLPENPSSCEGVMFSPDGAELALMLNSFSGHRLVCFDFATGQLSLDHDYRGRLGHYFYKGPKLDWLPDKSGLVYAGHLLLERSTGEEVWIFPSTDSNPRRFVAGGQVLVLLAGRNGKVLQTAELPEKQIASAMQSIRDGGAAIDSLLPPITTPNLFSASQAALPGGASEWSYQADAAGAMPRGVDSEVLVAKDGETIRRVGFAGTGSGKVVVQKEVTPRAVAGRRPPRQVVLERYDLVSGDKGNAVAVPYVYQLADISPSGKTVIVAFAQKGNNYERLDVLGLSPKKHVVGWRPYAGEREAAGEEKRPGSFRLWGQPDSPRSVVWAALLDDEHVVTVNTAGKLVLWRLPDCQAVYVFEEFGEPLALSPARRYLAGNHHGDFRLFDTLTGKCVGDLQSPQFGSRAVRGVFRADGQELAAIIDAGPDKMLARWNLQNGQLVDEMPVPPGAVGQYVPFYASRNGTRLGLEYRGADHVMIDDQYLVDLDKRAVTWKYHVAGFFAVNSPDHRTWYCTQKPNQRDNSLFLTAHDTPSGMVKQKAAGVTLEKQLVLQPGMSVRVHVDLGGVGLSDLAPAVERAVVEGLEHRGLKVDPGVALTFSLVAAERSTGENLYVFNGPFFNPFRDPSEAKEVVSVQELALRMSVSDSSGKVLWHLDRSVRMSGGLVKQNQSAGDQLRENMLRSFRNMLSSSGSTTEAVPRYIFAELPTIIAGESTLGFHQEGPPPEVKLPENQKGPPGVAPGT